MSGEVLDPGPGRSATSATQRAVAARAEAVVLLGDVRVHLSRWSKVLAEVELAIRSDDERPLDEHAELVSARNRLFDVMAELSELADPYVVWAAAGPDASDRS